MKELQLQKYSVGNNKPVHKEPFIAHLHRYTSLINRRGLKPGPLHVDVEIES